MANAGMLSLPVVSASTPAGDPLLELLGSFLQTAIRHYCGDAWAAIGGGTDVCERVETNDPTDNTFSTTKLPCLAVFRKEDSNDDARIADELFEAKSNVIALWVPPPAVQAWRAASESFSRALRAAVSTALTQERVPGWIVAGDTDPLTSAEGSNIVAALGLMRPILSVKTDDFPLVVEVEGAPARRYPAVKFTIPISEQIVAAHVARSPSKLNATITTNDCLISTAVEDAPDESGD